MNEKPFDGSIPELLPFVEPTVVDVEYIHRGERYHQYRMLNVQRRDGIGKVHPLLTTGGNTEREAEEWMHKTLRFHYGDLGYTIRVISRTAWKGGHDATACHDAPTK